jgi:hypothetical protein
MSPSSIDTLLGLMAATFPRHKAILPFANHSDLYNTIDSTPLGDVQWEQFSVRYNREVPDGDVPQWMSSKYEVWFRDPRLVVKDMVGNPDFKNDFDTTPVQIFDRHGSREYQNFMSGNWAWEEAVCLYDARSPFTSC